MEAKAIISSFLPAGSWHSHGIQHTWDSVLASGHSPKIHLPLTCFRQLWGTTAVTSRNSPPAYSLPECLEAEQLQELPLSFVTFDSPALPSRLETPRPCIKPLPSWNTKAFFAIMIYPWAIIVTHQMKAHLELFCLYFSKMSLPKVIFRLTT